MYEYSVVRICAWCYYKFWNIKSKNG